MMGAHEKTRTMAVAYPISQIFEKCKGDDEKAIQIAEEVIEQITRDSSLNRDAVQDLIDNLLGEAQGLPKRTRAKVESSQVKYGDYKGVLKVFPSSGKINLSFSSLTPEKVQELQERITQMLSGQGIL
jgi:DNA-directed RNA polymerase subunit F